MIPDLVTELAIFVTQNRVYDSSHDVQQQQCFSALQTVQIECRYMTQVIYGFVHMDFGFALLSILVVRLG